MGKNVKLKKLPLSVTMSYEEEKVFAYTETH